MKIHVQDNILNFVNFSVTIEKCCSTLWKILCRGGSKILERKRQSEMHLMSTIMLLERFAFLVFHFEGH